MQLLADGLSQYRTGIGLLAIHSAISLSDAIAVGLTGKRGKYQDHAQAASELESFCSRAKCLTRRALHISSGCSQRRMKWRTGATGSTTFPREWRSTKLRGSTRGHTLSFGRFCVYKRSLSLQQQESRAKTAVAELLFRELMVPKVFVDAPWPGTRQRVDVMAVERSGSGDVHVVEVHVGTAAPAAVEEVIASLMRIPAHFKYLAFFDNKNYIPDERWLYAPDGMGRVGVIQVTEDTTGNLRAGFLIRPERFRFDASFKQVDRFTATHPAYIEIRP